MNIISVTSNGIGSDGSQTIDTVRTLEKEEKFTRPQSQWSRTAASMLVLGVAAAVLFAVAIRYSGLFDFCLTPGHTVVAPMSSE